MMWFFSTSGFTKQPRNFATGLQQMSDFYTFVDDLVRSKKSAPVVYLSTNAQFAKKKPETRRYQTFQLSRILNELAHWAFELETPQVVPMVDFSVMMEQGFPWSVYDGTHCTEEVDLMKWQIILNFMCTEKGFKKIIFN